MNKYFKYNEIKSYFDNFVAENSEALKILISEMTYIITLLIVTTTLLAHTKLNNGSVLKLLMLSVLLKNMKKATLAKSQRIYLVLKVWLTCMPTL